MYAIRSYYAHAQGSDRVERRSEQMALPDSYLDPAWPEAEAATGT